MDGVETYAIVGPEGDVYAEAGRMTEQQSRLDRLRPGRKAVANCRASDAAVKTVSKTSISVKKNSHRRACPLPCPLPHTGDPKLTSGRVQGGEAIT